MTCDVCGYGFVVIVDGVTTSFMKTNQSSPLVVQKHPRKKDERKTFQKQIRCGKCNEKIWVEFSSRGDISVIESPGGGSNIRTV